ncbi:unnamed protein product [Rotaria sordida]|uniref:Arginine-glutamic acid dipeptide repeats protein n=1 Tax=Rotaria sordida TaxID=392033 RepID=A0A813ML68_9BILA|nr:unnamed protein product [Rotaria sordida]CAF0741450.1 unnamed protein product [Rotaria sordida]
MDAEDEQSLEERLRAQSTTTNNTNNNNNNNNNNTNKPLTTRVTTSSVKSNRHTFKDEKIESHTDKNGVCYRVGDHVYLETNKQAEPYSIACILDFRLTRKDHVMLEVRWYYRPAEIPPNLYHLLIEDRYHENQGNNQTSSIKDKQTKDSGIIQDPNIIGRELFVSEIKEFYPAVHIKGRCRVAHYQDIEEARAFKPDPDTFFYILTYNPEARRLANTQGEIRVGPSHQAKLPLLKSYSSSSLTNGINNDDLCSLREELLWKNKTSDIDLSMYLQAARSIAAFAGMCDRGLPEDMYEVAQRDDTTINALNVLHNHDYDCKRAIQALVKCPIPKGIDRKWSDDDQKKFIKGLRQYGKNFYRIRKEHLPHKETSDLVEFYYLWKKTPQAQSSRPRRRQRPCSTSANLSTTPTPAKQRNTKTNNKDESEHNSDNDDNTTITTDTDEQFCRHCQTISKDLQPGGRDSQQLCYDCRMYYKKYGEMPIINQEPPPYLFKPLNETSPSSSSKRKRNKFKQSSSPPSSTSTIEKSDENNSSIKPSSTRSKKKTRINEQTSLIKQESTGEEEENIKDESIINTGIKIEEQENEKPLIESSDSIPTTTSSGFLIKAEELSSPTLSQPLPPLITNATTCKQEINSPSSILSNGAAKITNKILIDHTKQTNCNFILSPSSTIKSEPISINENSSTLHPNLLQSSLLSSPRSAFSRTSKTSSIHSPDQRRIPKDEELDSPSSHRSQSHSNSLSHTPKSTSIHPTILSGDVTPSSLNLPSTTSAPPPPPLLIPSSLNESKDNDSLTTDMTDDGNISDSSMSGNHEISSDSGPAPLTCERECYNKPQGIVLLQVYDRSISQNSCARTDIILKRGSRVRQKQQQQQQQVSSNNNEQQQQQQQQQQQEIPSMPPMPSVPSSAAMMMMGLKQEVGNLSKLPFSLDKGPPLLHSSGPPQQPPPSFSTLNHHHDSLLMNRSSSLFHPLPLHAIPGGPKPPGAGTTGPPPLNFSSPFGPSLHDNAAALRHLDPLGFRLMNPAAAAAAQLFAAQSHYNTSIGRPTPGSFDPTTAVLLLDPRYRSMMSPFGTPSPSSAILPSPSNNTSASANSVSNNTHNHSHIHSHSHTHLHLGNTNDSPSSSSNNSNGPTIPPPPPPSMMPFGLSHGGQLLHSAGPPPPPSSMSSLEAMHNLSRERELMAFMLANGARFDPMALALAANPLQMSRHEDLSRLNARERSIREHNENEFRRFNLDMERQQQQLRFPFHH